MSTPPFLDLPAGVDALTLSTARGPFAALAARPPRPHGVVLLIPGWTGSKEDFIALLPLLSGDGWQAVTYDQRGQYESPGGPDDDYSLAGFGADAQAVADAVAPGEPVHLLGHSFGGLVAQQAALGAPDRWHSLTLLCTGPGAFPDQGKVALLRSTVEALRTRPLAEVYQVKIENDRARARPGGPPPEPIERFLRHRFVSNSAVSLGAMTEHLTSAPDRIDEVAALRLPVHVVYGEDDDGWPVATQQQVAERLGVTPHAIAGSAHSPNAENPTALADLLTRLLAPRPTGRAASAPRTRGRTRG
ncbi:MAG: alpha/beta fold hydrolase [Propionibacteriales bacterium]|nr:alpha/beta fold hydrolase [Propionibacteriales bacterium]